MRNQITPEAFASAMVVAENLKQQLEARLVHKTSQGWRCNCGSCSVGPSRVVGINIPTQYQYQVAMWLMWTCAMEDNTGKHWRQSISRYIPWTELYPMFRQAFAGIDVRVEHPFAQSYTGQPWGFTPSGRTIKLSVNSAVFVRPVGDLSRSTWVNAELRIDKSLPQYANNEALIACNIDALEFDQWLGHGQGQYFLLAKRSAFYIRIPGDGHGEDIYLPIARQVTVNKEAGTATLELDQSVEVFVPT